MKTLSMEQKQAKIAEFLMDFTEICQAYRVAIGATLLYNIKIQMSIVTEDKRYFQLSLPHDRFPGTSGEMFEITTKDGNVVGLAKSFCSALEVLCEKHSVKINRQTFTSGDFSISYLIDMFPIFIKFKHVPNGLPETRKIAACIDESETRYLISIGEDGSCHLMTGGGI